MHKYCDDIVHKELTNIKYYIFTIIPDLLCIQLPWLGSVKSGLRDETAPSSHLYISSYPNWRHYRRILFNDLYNSSWYFHDVMGTGQIFLSIRYRLLFHDFTDHVFNISLS